MKCFFWQAARETGHRGAGAVEIVRGIFRDKGPLGFFQVWGGSLFDNCDGLLVMMMTKAWTSIETTMTTFLERQEDDDNDEDDVDDVGVDA